MIELELDFSEEEVEFADRKQLVGLVNEIATLISINLILPAGQCVEKWSTGGHHRSTQCGKIHLAECHPGGRTGHCKRH